MIIAIPTASLVWVSPMGRERDKYLAQLVWWHWVCTTCNADSRPAALFSDASGALERGHNWHQVQAQCQEGQLCLFSL